MTSVIKIENLRKSFGNTIAIDGISFEINYGEMFGIVGPDGAGKTSTIKILCGLFQRFEGNVTVLDKEIRTSKKEIQRNIGYLSQKFSLYGDLSIDENIEFFAEIHDIRRYRERRDELLRFTRLEKFRERAVDKLSGGMRQKLALACCLIHKPKILFLDEPTTGVDPVSRRDFWKILSNLLKEKITIIMTTPYLDEAERCNRVAMMNKGKVIALDTPRKIKEKIGKSVIEIVCEPIKHAYEILKENFAFDIQLFGDRINVVVDNFENDLQNITSALLEKSIMIKSTREVTASLENVFIYKIKEAG